MAVDFISLMFTWLLLTASGTVTSGQTIGFTEVMTTEVHGTAQTQVTSSFAPPKVLVSDATTSTTAEGTQTEETTGIQTTAQTALTSAYSTLSWINTSAGSMVTAEDLTVEESTTIAGNTQANNPTEFTTATPKLSRSTQSLNTGETPTVVFTSATPGASTHRSQPTRNASTATTSAKPEESTSYSTSPATGDDGGLTRSTASDQTSAAATIIPITKPKKQTNPPGEKAKPNTGTNHGKVVAGLIGGALLLMMVGFLVIYLKKRKLQRQKTNITEWAGPSPFLESGYNNGHAALRSSNRVSLSSFLPQRLSKRLSLLPETDEEMEDMTPATTFASKHLENPTVDGNGVQESNGSAPVVPDVKSTGESTEAGKTSSNNSESTNNSSEVTNLNQNQSENPSDLSEVGEKSNSAN